MDRKTLFIRLDSQRNLVVSLVTDERPGSTDADKRVVIHDIEKDAVISFNPADWAALVASVEGQI
jgi:hypothetical protein